MAHSRNLRKGRFSINQGIYLATFATKNRKLLFKDFYLARIAIRYLNNSPYAETLTYVVMPNHVHWLLQLNTAKTISQVIRGTKSIISRDINRRIEHKGTIWQAGFHDHAIRNEEAIREIGRYVVANPVRAKLVRKVGDYPHWDAIWVNNSRSRCVSLNTHKNDREAIQRDLYRPTKAIEISDKTTQKHLKEMV